MDVNCDTICLCPFKFHNTTTHIVFWKAKVVAKLSRLHVLELLSVTVFFMLPEVSKRRAFKWTSNLEKRKLSLGLRSGEYRKAAELLKYAFFSKKCFNIKCIVTMGGKSLIFNLETKFLPLENLCLRWRTLSVNSFYRFDRFGCIFALMFTKKWIAQLVWNFVFRFSWHTRNQHKFLKKSLGSTLRSYK